MSNVVSIHQEEPSPVEEKATPTKKGVEARWGAKLGKSFTPISSYLLHNAFRVKPLDMPHAKGLSPSEVMVVIHLFDHQWGERNGYPSLLTIAKRMSLSRRQVRDIVKRLEDLKLLTRIPGPPGSTNRYDLAPLKKRLEALMAEEVDAADAAELAKLDEASDAVEKEA